MFCEQAHDMRLVSRFQKMGSMQHWVLWAQRITHDPSHQAEYNARKNFFGNYYLIVINNWRQNFSEQRNCHNFLVCSSVLLSEICINLNLSPLQFTYLKHVNLKALLFKRTLLSQPVQATVTKYNRLAQTIEIFLQFWRLEVQHQGAHMAGFWWGFLSLDCRRSSCYIFNVRVPPTHILNLNAQCVYMVFGTEVFGRWLGHECRTKRNVFNVLVKRDSKQLPYQFYVRIQRKDGSIWTRKGVLTRYWVCCCLDLGHLYLQFSEKSMFNIDKPPSLWYFCYSSPNRCKTSSQGLFFVFGGKKKNQAVWGPFLQGQYFLLN